MGLEKHRKHREPSLCISYPCSTATVCCSVSQSLTTAWNLFKMILSCMFVRPTHASSCEGKEWEVFSFFYLFVFFLKLLDLYLIFLEFPALVATFRTVLVVIGTLCHCTVHAELDRTIWLANTCTCDGPACFKVNPKSFSEYFFPFPNLSDSYTYAFNSFSQQ